MNDNSKKIQQKTFGDLIQQYKIIIPKIQRDYAQGREQEKLKSRKFLEYIKKNLKSYVDLDFIYGVVDTKESVNIFKPIDGQQRLTTSFLLYYYATLKEGTYEQHLRNFSYELRPSSIDFFNQLTEKENWEKLKGMIRNGLKLTEAIENSNWFFKVWKRDPTVKAVLKMFDWIEEIFKDFDELVIDKVKNNLKFKFLDLEKYKLEDDIYVKMNARGKPLTHLENFKARLFEFIPNYNQQAKFDNEYLDIFWEKTKERKNSKSFSEDYLPILTDRYYYALLYHTLLNIYVREGKLEKNRKLEEFIDEDPYLDFGIKIIKENKNFLDELITFLDKLHELNRNNSENILQPLWEIIYKEDEFIKTKSKKDVFKNPEETLKKLSYYERLKLYAIYSYLVNCFDEDYLRVMFNLINNRRVDETKEFIEAINAIEEVNKNFKGYKGKNPTNCFLVWLKHKGKNKIKFFRRKQVDEEVQKAELILNNPSWREPIEEAEKHWYLQGNVGFLIEFSGNDIQKFREYYEKFKKLWDEVKNNKNLQILLYRALLTFGDYMPNIGSYKTFCKFETGARERLENWISVFEDENRQKFLKQLLDNLDINQDIKTQLENIVKGFKEDCKDWRTYLIKNPDCIEYCKDRRIYIEENGDRFKRLLLLSKTQTSSMHRELFTWDLFKKHFKPNERIENRKIPADYQINPFRDIYYLESSSRSVYPKIVMEEFEFKGSSIKIEVYFNEKWYIELKTSEENQKIPEEIISLFDGKTQWEYELCEGECLFFKIRKITEKLNDLTKS